MRSESKQTIETMRYEEAFESGNTIVWKCKGRSMKPFICEGKDLVVLEKISAAPRPYDVVLYRRKQTEAPDRAEAYSYVLHRLLEVEGESCVILGDNCVTLEHIPKKDLIAVMRGLIRDGKEVNTDSIRYKLYQQLWIKPWKLRIGVIRGRIRIVRFISRLMPASVKSLIKRTVRK